jgi:hypothetical protein
MTLSEITYISQFDIQSNGCIGVRKTTDIVKDGAVISSTYWRTVLVPNDPQASVVLNEPYYASIAQAAWTPEVSAAFQAAQEANRPAPTTAPEPTPTPTQEPAAP